ncbi:MAG TPA: PRC-barrel domain-containing protein [Aliidongia sp.]|uniref:PRC-barrel domain-containing protein n=1 Tax=Aliidongia sp. TaxID=1914230 RepID=UPI002DDD2D71|nr:PRC-barrel domain-containing protein [Aliidongia sp.]HEV2673763.1 PRC-barrel domain-containing protein [Aliidongia sp.]
MSRLRTGRALLVLAGLVLSPPLAHAGDDPSPSPSSGPAPDAASVPSGQAPAGNQATPPPMDQPASPPPAPSPPPPPPAPAKEVPQPPKNLEPIPKTAAISVLGKKVHGPAGEDMGRVVDLLLDRDGRLQTVVIDFGGFLGVGSRKIAIDWRLVRFVPDDADAPIALSLGKADVQAAPEYKDTAQPPVMVGPPPSGPDVAR